MAKWNAKQILSFLEVYETYDVLWNVECHLYRDRVARDDALKKLLNELNIEGLTVDDLRRKIKMIKTVYSAELNKIMKSKKDEAETAVIYTPKLSWFQKADSFLRNVTVSRSPTVVEPIRHNNAVLHREKVKGTSSCLKKIKCSKKITVPSKSFLKTSQRNSVDVVQKTVSSLKSITDSTAIHQEDELDHFGKYIVAMLRQLPPLNSLLCQQEIQNTLTRERIAVMEREQNSSPLVQDSVVRSPSPCPSQLSSNVSGYLSPGSSSQIEIKEDIGESIM